jgi:primosomal replication protein N
MIKKFMYLASTILLIASCRETYTPPEVTVDQNILVEGFIQVNADSSFLNYLVLKN